MIRTKSFEEFVQRGVARRISIDKERAKNLLLKSRRKNVFLKEVLNKVGIKNDNANDYVEWCYDILMYLIRAKLYLDGYSASGLGAHEAEVSYLLGLKITEKEVQFIDQIRYFRNMILYYGKSFDEEYAKKVIEFTKRMSPQLEQMVEQRV